MAVLCQIMSLTIITNLPATTKRKTNASITCPNEIVGFPTLTSQLWLNLAVSSQAWKLENGRKINYFQWHTVMSNIYQYHIILDPDNLFGFWHWPSSEHFYASISCITNIIDTYNDGIFHLYSFFYHTFDFSDIVILDKTIKLFCLPSDQVIIRNPNDVIPVWESVPSPVSHSLTLVTRSRSSVQCWAQCQVHRPQLCWQK